MLALSLYVFLAGYALFLLGFAVFMYFENQKFGDNQFTMKLLPPPPRTASVRSSQGARHEALREESAPVSDWTPVPARSVSPVPAPRLSRAA